MNESIAFGMMWLEIIHRNVDIVIQLNKEYHMIIGDNPFVNTISLAVLLSVIVCECVAFEQSCLASSDVRQLKIRFLALLFTLECGVV